MYVPPKMAILFSFFLLHRSKVFWGADAEEFKPDRWFDQEVQQRVSTNPGIFTPFASGPRNVSVIRFSSPPPPRVGVNECLQGLQCVGQNYALNEVTLFLARLLQCFDEFAIDERKQLLPPWRRDPGVDIGLKDPRSGTLRRDIEKIWPGFTIVIHINGGLWIRFRKASE